MKQKLIFIIMLFTLCMLGSCGQPDTLGNAEVSGTEFVLDTIATITLFEGGGEAELSEAFKLIRDMESEFSHSKAGSLPDLLKQNAALEYVKLSADAKSLLESSIYYSKLSEGAFDITIGPLVELWNISGGGYYPEPYELETAKSLVGYDNIFLSDGGAMLRNEGMSVNFGAIAKGFIGDRVKKLLMDKGVKSGIIYLGGDIVLIGNKPDGKAFNIGVQNPQESDGDYFAVISLRDKSIVTSGTYERFFTYEGINYHHLIDPKTGFPADNGLVQVTIISDSLTDGDALSTAAFVMGLEDGLKLIESIDGVQGIFVTEEKKVYTTTGIGNEFKIVNEDYSLY